MKRHTIIFSLVLAASLLALATPDVALATAEHAVATGEHAAAAGEQAEAIPWMALGLHTFNLILLLGVIAWFAGGKIRDSMRTRTAGIKSDIDESNRLRKEARERFEELEWRLAGIEGRLGDLHTEAEQQAEAERLAILERADRDADRLREAAQRTIRSETAKARMALRRDAVSVAVKLAEQRISANVGAEDDTRFANDFFSEIDTEVTHV